MVAISLTLSAILAIVLGLVVLLFPNLLRWAVGIYLIAFGIIQLLGGYLQFSPF